MQMMVKKVIKPALDCKYLTMYKFKQMVIDNDIITIMHGNQYPPTMNFSYVNGENVVHANVIGDEGFELVDKIWQQLKHSDIIIHDNWSITFSGKYILYAILDGILASNITLLSLQQQLSYDVVTALSYPTYDLSMFLVEYWWDADWGETKILIEVNNEFMHIGKTSIPVPLAYLLREFDLDGCLGDSGVESLILALLYSKLPVEKFLTHPLGDFEYGKLLKLLEEQYD